MIVGKKQTECWEAFVPDAHCNNYEENGYTCAGDWCAQISPGLAGGEPELCANFVGSGCSIDDSTGRCIDCSTEGISGTRDMRCSTLFVSFLTTDKSTSLQYSALRFDKFDVLFNLGSFFKGYIGFMYLYLAL